jgi:hypothetical protein
MTFWNKICGLFAIFLLSALHLSAQTLTGSGIQNPSPSSKQSLKSSSSVVFKPMKEVKKPAFSIIPQNYYSDRMGIICKKEWALERSTRIPFRIRLGSLQQCNYLEGKK